MRYLWTCKNQLFFYFSIYLRNCKEFSKSQWLFQVLLSTIFDKKSGTFNDTFLTWSLLTCKIFSKKSWFLSSDKSHIQKSGNVTASFALSKNKKNSKPTRLITYFKIWIQSQVLLKNFAWNFRNTFFAEHIWVAASWNYILVSTLSFRGTPRLWNTFESASFTLDNKSVVKINYDVRHSATKLKKHKVQNWVNTDIFKQHFR